MSMLSIGLALAIRAVLVLLFLPFSALDKVLDFRSAVAQAREEVPNKAVTDIGRTILLLRTTLFR
jgi:putative oxidoreductase